jgi:hypothetical protein
MKTPLEDRRNLPFCKRIKALLGKLMFTMKAKRSISLFKIGLRYLWKFSSN